MGNWLACVSGGFRRSVPGLEPAHEVVGGRPPSARHAEADPRVEAAEVDITDEA
jgi:hypothetical protein